MCGKRRVECLDIDGHLLELLLTAALKVQLRPLDASVFSTILSATTLPLSEAHLDEPLGVVVRVTPVAHPRCDAIDARQLLRGATEDVVERAVLKEDDLWQQT